MTSSTSIDTDQLDILRRFYRANHRLPTYSEMARLFEYQSKHAAFRLAKKLIDAGYIDKEPSGKLIPNKERFGLPLVGYVQAGFPSPAEEALLDTLTLDHYLIHKPHASFLLKVTGDSMIEAGIHPDDVVIIERGRTPKNGDIVLAEIDRAWTLKTFQKKGREVMLIPANKKYPVLFPREELNIAGVMVGLVRKYG